jgi:nucleotide-binding universal stress UspA family protein
MTRVLVPVEVLEGKTVSPGLLTLLGTVDVTVLGYHVLPEQTPPGQARMQYEDRATAALSDLVEEFRAVGGEADHRLVFTHDREQTIDRIADEVDARAVAVSGMTGTVEQVLVSLSGDVAVERILTFVEELVGDRDIGVTLFLATKDETAGTEQLDAAATRLREAGLSVGTVVTEGPPFERLFERVAGHDAIVVGEAAPSWRSFVFGDETDRLASASVSPVIVVRADGTRETPPED